MKRTWMIMALLATFGYANAQEVDTARVERQINIEKEYTPEIKDVKRKDIEYQVEETSVRPSNLTYSNYALPINPQTPFSPLEAEKQSVVKLKPAKTGYADLGLGFAMNWRAEGYCKILNTDADFLDVHLNHLGTYWGKKDPKVDIRSGINFDYKHFFTEGHQVDANVMYRNLYYSYYGADEIDWDDLKDMGLKQFQCWHTLNVSAGAHSTKSMNDWDYKAEIGYRMNDFQYYNLVESHLSGGITGYKSFGKHQIELKLNGDGYIFTSENDWAKKFNNAYIGIAPYYNLNMSFMDVRAGVRMLLTCKRGQVFTAMPDVTVTFHPHRMVRITAAAVGDYRSNTSSSLIEANPYEVYIDTMKDTYTPADFRLALTVTPVSDLSLSARVQYAITKNEVNYYNYQRYFFAQYVDAQHLQVGVNASYMFKERYSFHADFAWNKWYTKGDDVMLYKPEIELLAGVELMPIEGLRFDISYYLATGRLCGYITTFETSRMTDIHDLNLGASYLIKKLVTVYVRANNILGSIDSIRWQRWNGYDNIGFNMTFGAKIAF